jgi:hypothetical protein
MRSAWFWKLIASYQKRNRKQLDARTWWLLETRRSGKTPTIYLTAASFIAKAGSIPCGGIRLTERLPLFPATGK